jgi:hypothetical protein
VDGAGKWESLRRECIVRGCRGVGSLIPSGPIIPYVGCACGCAGRGSRAGSGELVSGSGRVNRAALTHGSRGLGAGQGEEGVSGLVSCSPWIAPTALRQRNGCILKQVLPLVAHSHVLQPKIRTTLRVRVCAKHAGGLYVYGRVGVMPRVAVAGTVREKKLL